MKPGILVVFKPEGITSHCVISKLRYLLQERQIGHCGTLDPMASGVLPVMIGSAVKASDYLVEHDKCYTAGITLGITTDTQDTTGKVISRYEGRLPGFEEFRSAAEAFQGEIMQTPPMYSALKVGGVKLLDYAREGITVERNSRAVTIHSIHAFERDGGYYLDVHCSRGTYIRTLCEDIGRALGCGGCMSSLVRTRVGRFRSEDSVFFDDLNGMTVPEIKQKMIPVEDLFMQLPAGRLEPFYEHLYRNGEKIKTKKLRGIDGEPGTEYRIYNENGFYSVGIITEKDGITYFGKKKLF